MSDYQDKFIPVRLEALSPVHIGAGKDNMLSPFNCHIEQEESGFWLYTLDIDTWLDMQAQVEPDKLAQEIENAGSLNGVWEVLRKKINKKTLEAFTLSKSKVSKEIYELYLSRLTSSESKNELAQGIRNSQTQAMLIPGSSIKGAIRTAIIQSKDNGQLKRAWQEDKSRGTYYTQKLEAMFGNIRENDFQALKVSDFELLPDQSAFVRPVEKNINPDKPSAKMKEICETMQGGTKLYGRFVLGRTSGVSVKYPLEPWTFDNLAVCCNKYYKTRFLNELQKFYTLSQFAEVKRVAEELKNYIAEDKNKDAILLRVGHYSHIECMTVERNDPKTRPLPKGRGFFPFGQTRTLADGLYPFGWVLLHRVSEEDYIKGMQEQEEKRKNFIATQRKRRQYFISALQKEKEDKIKDQEEKERIRKEEEAAQRRVVEDAEQKKQKETERTALAEKEKEDRKKAETERREKLREEERWLEDLEQGKTDSNQLNLSSPIALKLFEMIEHDKLDENLKLRAILAIEKNWKKEGKYKSSAKDNQKMRNKMLFAWKTEYVLK